ncbi:MAG TPA: PfkB family carbohydrate kinase [Chloroflexota bacterium]|nr:PfkB family carbohydrate kinase [Chloroflexota bacterium]
MTTYDVLLQGSAYCDLTFSFTSRDQMPQLGQEVFADRFAINPGGIFIIVSTLTRLGVSVGWRTELGSDIFSRFIGEQMQQRGIPDELVLGRDEPLPLVTAGVSFPHDRLFISYQTPRFPDDALALTDSDLDRFRPRVLFTYGEVGLDLMRAARERGILVYLDTFWNPEHLRSAHLRSLLDHVDVFAPNLIEAQEMTQSEDVEGALDTLSAWCRGGVIKCGERGCVGWRGRERFEIPALPVAAVETTGAGDNFNAGLIYGLLRGWSFETCLRCGNIAGGLSTRSLGGCEGTVSAAEIDGWLQRLGWQPARKEAS